VTSAVLRSSVVFLVFTLYFCALANVEYCFYYSYFSQTDKWTTNLMMWRYLRQSVRWDGITIVIWNPLLCSPV